MVIDRGARVAPPALRRAGLRRPRLLQRLEERFRTPITVVVGPAGFGKTTLLAQSLDESESRGSEHWLTCRAEDAAASSLAEGLSRSLGLASVTHVQDASVPIVDAIWHRSPGEVTLLLDDVHEIPAESSGAELLARIVDAMPHNCHLVLAGRQAPPIPLARRQVNGEVLRLDADDLLFTDGELDDFAAHRGVPSEQLAGCGGWPALAELAASARPGVDAEYLWEEVLTKLEPDRRRSLALLAHIGVFDDELAEAVLGHGVDVDALTADLPLVTATSDGGRQIHSLWRPHLAKAVGEQAIAEVRRRAGLEMARAGDVAAAVRLLTEANAWDDVTVVVVAAFGASHPPIPGDIVATWLGRLPDELAESSLARLLGAASAVQTDPKAATPQLEEAAAAFREEGNLAGELACMAQLAQVAWWSEQPERLALLAQRVLEMAASGFEAAAPLAHLGRALIYDMAADCTSELEELDRITPGSVNQTTQSLVDWLRSTTLQHLGRHAEAMVAIERAVAQAAPLHEPAIEATRMQVLWFLGHIEEVQRGLPPLVDAVEATGLRDYTALAAAASAIGLSAGGRVEEAARFVERARGVAASPELPLIDANLVIGEAVVAVTAGDEARAADLMEDYIGRSAPLATGLAAFPQQRALTLWYILLPSTREVWDAATLGPTFILARELARSVVALRDVGTLPADAPELPASGVVRAALPLPWATELALGYIAAGQQAGWSLLDALWPQAQGAVRRWAGRRRGEVSRAARAALGRLPVPPDGRFRLNLLGPTELRCEDAPVDAPEWRRERVRSLLAHLALHRPVNRERLASDLWPTLDADAQSRNLRVNLTHLLRVLEPNRAERDAAFLIRPHGGSLMLHRGEWFQADIWEFDELWQRAEEADQLGHTAAALQAMQRAVALWRDDPSELAAEEWALPEVEQRRLQLVTMAVRAGELLLARGEPEAARQMGEAALRADPWSEGAHHVVVASHVAAGDHKVALAAIDRYQQVLTELGFSTAEVNRRVTQLRRHVLVPTA